MKKITSTQTGIFLRGSFNDWSLRNEFAQCSDGSYVVRNIQFHTGTNEFKIADSHWTQNCNYGYTGSKPGMFCFRYILTANTDANMTIITKQDILVDVYLYKTETGLQIRLKPVKSKRA